MSASKVRGSISQTGTTIVMDAGGSNQYTVQVGSGSGITVTMPSTTDTLVGRDTTDPLTNKTITDGSNAISADLLTSGTIPDTRIQASGVTQYTTSIDHDILTNFVANEHIDWTSTTSNLSTTGTLAATSINKVTVTAPATGSTLTIAEGKTLLATTSLTINTGDVTLQGNAAGSTVTLPTGGTLATIGGTETLAFKTLTSPTLNTPVINRATTLQVQDTTTTSRGLSFASNSIVPALTADRTLTFNVDDGDRTVRMQGNLTVSADSAINQDVTTGTTPTFAGIQSSNAITFDQIATPSTPAAGDNKVYFKSDDKLYKLDSSGIELEVGSGAGGSGEVNFCLNPNAESAVDNDGTNDIGDWIGSGNLAASRITTPELRIPRFPFQEQSIGIQSTDTVASGDVRLRFRVPAADRNKKLKVEWAQNTAGYTTGFLVLEMYSYSDSAFSADERQYTFSGSTDIPEQTGVYYNEFDSDDREYYEMRIVYDTALFATSGIFLNDVVIGPGKLHSGAVITAWQDWSPDISDFMSATGLTFTSSSSTFRRVGGSYEVRLNGTFTGTGTEGSDLQLPVPNGHTPTVISTNNMIGSGYGTQQSGTNDILIVRQTSASTLVLRRSDRGSIQSPSLNGTHFGSVTSTDVETISVFYTVSVSELSGSGVLNTIVQDNLTEWTFYDMTAASTDGFGTPSSDSVHYRRVGENLEVLGRFTTGTVDGTTAAIYFPNELTRNQSKFATAIICGEWWVNEGVATQRKFGTLYAQTNRVTFGNSHYDIASSPATQQAGNVVASSTEVVWIKFSVPVAEWAGSQSSLVGFTKASQGTLGLTTTTGTGMVPLGAIIPIASNLTGAYSVPGTGTVSNEGWMYCDGSAIPASQSLSGTLPDLTDSRFLMGSTSAGSRAGSNTLVDHTHTFSLTYPNHTHTDNFSTASAGSHSHTVTNTGNSDAIQLWSSSSATASDSGVTRIQVSGQVSNNKITTGTYVYLDTDSQGAHTHTVNGGITSSGGGSVSGSVGSGSAATSTESRPLYHSVQYVIRVK